MTSGGDVLVTALSHNDALATAAGASKAVVSLASVGVSKATATVGDSGNPYVGLTKAHIDGTVTGAQNVMITAKTVDDATADAAATSGGILGLATLLGANAEANISTTVEAFASRGADLTATNLVHVFANGDTFSHAKAEGVNGGLSGATVGESNATTNNNLTIFAFIGDDATVTAAEITVEALQTDRGDSFHSTLAEARSSSGALIAGASGVSVNANSTAYVTAAVGACAMLDATNSVNILSTANNKLKAIANGNAEGLLSGGSVEGNATANTNATASVGSNAVISALNDVGVNAIANTTVLTEVVGGAGTTLSEALGTLFKGDLSNIGLPSIFSAGGAASTVNVNNTAQADIGTSASIAASDRVDITATAMTDVLCNVQMTTTGTTIASATAFVDANVDSDAIILIREGASIQGNDVVVDSSNQAQISTFAEGFAEVDVEGAFGTGISKLDLGTSSDPSEARITMEKNVAINGLNTLTLEATSEPKNGNLLSHAKGKAETNLFIGIAVANADGTAFVESAIESDTGSSLTSGDLTAHAESQLVVERIAETISSTLITKLLTVLTTITETIQQKVCEWLTWPFDVACSFFTKTITRVVETVTEVFVAAESFPSQGGGGLSSSDTINLNGDIFNVGTQNRGLRINADGTVDPASNVGVTFSGSDALVDDIIADPRAKMNFLVPRGQLTGNAILHVDKMIGRIDVENRSDFNLVFQEIQVISDADIADVDVTSEFTVGQVFEFDETIVASVIDVHNIRDDGNPDTANSNIVFTQSFSNVTGFNNIENDRGSILTGNSDIFIESGDVGHLVMIAEGAGSDVGEPGDAFDVRLLRGKVFPDGTLADTPAELVVQAGDDIFLNVSGRNTFADLTDTVVDTADGFALHLTAGNEIDVSIVETTVVDTDLVSYSADGIYNIVQADSVGGNVDIAVEQTQPAGLALGAMDRFLGPNGTPVDSVTGLEPTIANTVDPGLVRTGTSTVRLSTTGWIRDEDGDTSTEISAPVSVLIAGQGIGQSGNSLQTTLAKLEASAGTSIFIENTGSLEIGNVTAVHGVSGESTIDISNDGSITVSEAVSSTTGPIRLYGTGDITLSLLQTTGDVTVDSSSGSILDNTVESVDVSDIIATTAVLQAANGVGTPTNPLETTLSKLEVRGGEGGVHIDDMGGLVIGTITEQPEGLATTGLSADGNILVTTTGPMTVSEDVTSTSGSVVLEAVDAAGNGQDMDLGPTRVTADVNVTLLAGDDFTSLTGTSISAAGHVLIAGDHGNADTGSGSTMTVRGTVSGNSIEIRGAEDDDDILLDQTLLLGPTFVTADEGRDRITACQMPTLPDPLTLDGQGGSDEHTVDVRDPSTVSDTGTSYLINVFDSGSNDTDTLTVNGTNLADNLLMRASEKENLEDGVAFVAALHNDPTTAVERINYDKAIEELIVETHEGNDTVTLDDNWTESTVRGGADEDTFQVGQIFETPRDEAAGVAAGDVFETVSTTRGFLSNGVSFATVIKGGDDNDRFVVFRNTAVLSLRGDEGDDEFTIRSFAEEEVPESNGELGQSADSVDYVVNAPVDVNGGADDDTLNTIGTEFADRYLCTASSVQGMGRTIPYTDMETLVVNGAEGDDVGSLSVNALTGLGMGASGIGYANLEAFELLLGTGDDTLTVTGTADGMITALHGGGGADNVTVEGRGGVDSRGLDAPLVIFGDTSQDGIRYIDTAGTVNPGFARSFTNHGGDTIDASGSSEGVVIYGGVDNDTLTGSQAGDHIAGGSGADTIDAQAGDDHVYGDSGFNLDLMARVLTVPTNDQSSNPSGDDLSVGEDTILGGADNDIILGDHGVVTQASGTVRILTTGNVVSVETNEFGVGVADIIAGEAGEDLILAGLGADEIAGGPDDDIAIGDHGEMELLNGVVRRIETLDRIHGAVDTIEGNVGQDILIGGAGGDVIDGGAEDDLIFGDNVLLDRTGSVFGDFSNPRYQALSGTEIYDKTLRPGQAGEVLVDGTPRNNPRRLSGLGRLRHHVAGSLGRRRDNRL